MWQEGNSGATIVQAQSEWTSKIGVGRLSTEGRNVIHVSIEIILESEGTLL